MLRLRILFIVILIFIVITYARILVLSYLAGSLTRTITAMKAVAATATVIVKRLLNSTAKR
jgi:hypothetical protein